VVLAAKNNVITSFQHRFAPHPVKNLRLGTLWPKMTGLLQAAV
jgi:hypothetical protein